MSGAIYFTFHRRNICSAMSATALKSTERSPTQTGPTCVTTQEPNISSLGPSKKFTIGYCHLHTSRGLFSCVRTAEVGKMTTFDLWPIPWGGEAWGAGTNMWHPVTPASYESLPAPSGHTFPHFGYIHRGGGGDSDNRSMWHIWPIFNCRCPPLCSTSWTRRRSRVTRRRSRRRRKTTDSDHQRRRGRSSILLLVS